MPWRGAPPDAPVCSCFGCRACPAVGGCFGPPTVAASATRAMDPPAPPSLPRAATRMGFDVGGVLSVKDPAAGKVDGDEDAQGPPLNISL